MKKFLGQYGIYFLLVFILILGIFLGITAVKKMPKVFSWVIPKPEIITETITSPAKIVTVKSDPVIVTDYEYLPAQDGKSAELSFKKDLPYQDKEIKTDNADLVFNGTYHVTMDDNKLSVVDEIIGNAKSTITYTEKEYFNEVGVTYGSLGGAGGYYKRYFNKILFLQPWAEGVWDQKPRVEVGLGIKF